MAKIDPQSAVHDSIVDGVDAFGIVSKGAHVCIVVRAEEKVSMNSGQAMVVVDFAVEDPNDKDNGKRIMWQYFLPQHEKMKGNYIQLCRSVGAGVHDYEDQSDLDRVFLNKMCVVDVKHERDTYNGEDRVKAKARRTRALSDDEKANMKNHVATKSEVQTDDDIPF